MGREADKVVPDPSGAARVGRSHAQLLAAGGADIIAVDICADIGTNEYRCRGEDLDETARLVEKEDSRRVTRRSPTSGIMALSAGDRPRVAELGRLGRGGRQRGHRAVDGGFGHRGIRGRRRRRPGGRAQPGPLQRQTSGPRCVDRRHRLDGRGAQRRQRRHRRGRRGAGYGFAKQVVAHYVNDLALQMAPKNIRVNAVHPTNVNTDMLYSPPMYRAFRRT